MPVTVEKPAPYAPASAVLDIVGRYRNRGLPGPINVDVLRRVGVSESLIPRTLYALQALDLIDEAGQPTPTFEALRLAPEAEYRQRKADWLRGAYADVFAVVDPTEDGPARIRDAFRNYQPVGQQDRMVTLFTGLASEAGIIPKKPAGPRTPSVQRRVSSLLRAAKRTPPTAHHAPASANGGVGLPAPLAGLLSSLPTNGEAWTKEERDKFVTTFGVVLDFCIPVGRKRVTAQTEEDGGNQ